jgi:hypothetical protein
VDKVVRVAREVVAVDKVAVRAVARVVADNAAIAANASLMKAAWNPPS